MAENRAVCCLFVPSGRMEPVNQLGAHDTVLRLEHGLAAWKTGAYDLFVVAGGIFNPPKIQTEPAGAIMKQWLVERGVPVEAILDENRSRDTFENVQEVETLLRKRYATRRVHVTVMTQWQHGCRFWLTFLLGYGRRVRIAPVRYQLPFKVWLMECFFILYHALDWRGTGWLARKNRAQRTFS